MAARCVWLFGARRVIVIDCVDYRLEFARDYAPCEAYDFRSVEDSVVSIKRTTESLGADVCIDTSPKTQNSLSCISVLRWGVVLHKYASSEQLSASPPADHDPLEA